MREKLVRARSAILCFDKRGASWNDDMRILYDHQVFSLQNYGGGSVYFCELASRLSQIDGIFVDVFLGFNRCRYPFVLNRRQARVHGWKSSIPPGLLRYAMNEMVTSIQCVSSAPWDIYHSTLYRGMPAVRARRIVATNHDCTQERFPELFDDAGRVFRAKRRLYERADAIMCVSELSQKDLIEFYGVARSKTHVVHQGVPQLFRVPEQAQDFLAQLHRPYILFVGARYSYKNFRGLLYAYASGGFAKEYDLVVVGGGEFTEDEKGEMRRLGISESVAHWKYASAAILAEAYARAQLFVSPSLYEGFGLPPLEALSLGCAVLASNSASIPEICGDAATYFDPGREGDLERGLRDALNDPDRRQRIELGLRTVARYSWQKNAEGTLAVYRTI
jgi:glycosyltransferase involved in cell wall biosynthesis